MNNYPELTAEQYREELQTLFNKITYKQALRYFYIIVSEAVKSDPYINCEEGACHE